MSIHVGLVSKSLNCDWIELYTSEMDFGFVFLSSLKSELDLETWSERSKVGWEINCGMCYGHPQVIPQSPQNTSQVVMENILIAREVAAHLTETLLVANLNKPIITWTDFAMFHHFWEA